MPTKTPARRKGAGTKAAGTRQGSRTRDATKAAPKTGKAAPRPAPRAAAKAAAAPKRTKTAAAGGRGRSNALQQPLTPSPELAAVVGKDPLPRTEVVSKVWDYNKSRNLQNPENRREILADEALEKVFGKPKVTMFEMNKHLARHLS